MFAKLTVDPLEAREIPAVIGWVKGGPQPEPPTKLPVVQITAPSRVGALPSDPVLNGRLGWAGAMPEDPLHRVRVELPAVGILLPALNVR